MNYLPKGLMPKDGSNDFTSTNLENLQSEYSRWQTEAMRLSRRIMDLELENANLRQTVRQINSAVETEVARPTTRLHSTPVTGTLNSSLSSSTRSIVALAAAAASRRRRQDTYHGSTPPELASKQRAVGGDMRKSHTYTNLNLLEGSFGAVKNNPMPRSSSHKSIPQLAVPISEPVRLPSSVPSVPEEPTSAVLTISNTENTKNTVKDYEKSFQEGGGVSTEIPTAIDTQKDTIRYSSPSLGIDTRERVNTQSEEISMWVGTWNMGAADPFSDADGIIDERNSGVMVQQFIDHGYDLYVLGVQECISENVYHAIEAFLNRNQDQIRFYRMKLQNNHFLMPLKAHASDAVLDAVHGRGDGAFMGTKFTGIAVFYSARIQEDIGLIRAAVHKFNIASGSKGGACVALRLLGTTIAFVNCHLDAKNDSNRRDQIKQLNTSLGRNIGNSDFDLTEQFHHVVWMGDLNYRIHTLDAETALHMLSQGRNEELHDKFDSLLVDQQHGVFMGFVEPKKDPAFYPTYKKYEQRGSIDLTNPMWPEKVYRVLYKEPFYKGGQVKSRVPGWCDRILIHSTSRCSSSLRPEKAHDRLGDILEYDNYRSINQGVGMDISDHSPVLCTLNLRSRRNRLTPRPSSAETSSYGRHSLSSRHTIQENRPSYTGRCISSVLRIFNVVLKWNGHQVTPKKFRIVVPLLGEDDQNRQSDVIGERSSGNALSVTNVVVQHVQPLKDLHMLIWTRHESILGHNVVSLKGLHHSGSEIRYQTVLRHHSNTVYCENTPVILSFSVRAILSK